MQGIRSYGVDSGQGAQSLRLSDPPAWDEPAPDWPGGSVGAAGVATPALGALSSRTALGVGAASASAPAASEASGPFLAGSGPPAVVPAPSPSGPDTSTRCFASSAAVSAGRRSRGFEGGSSR